MEPEIKVGLVGACARGGDFKAGCEAAGLRIVAACDVNAVGLKQAAERLGAREQYTDLEEMLEKSALDAIVVGTPMPLHVPQSIAALERGIHVLSEVPAGVSIEECRRLVDVCRGSKAVYMMAENYIYTKANVLIAELVRRGLFGETYYAEGEYLHELKELNERTPWRRKWQTGLPGVTYPTHSLGAILQWMPGDRVVKVACEDARFRYRDPRGEPYGQTTPVMLCKTAKGALIKIRVDMVSDRPHSMTTCSLQGSDGCYESARAHGDRNRIWLRSLGADVRWHDLDALMADELFGGKYLPAMWREPPEGARRAGHGGGDYFEILDFVNAIRGVAPCPVGIDAAMDMTLPGLVSQQSVQQGGAWLDVPDSRTWGGSGGVANRQLRMVWPEERAGRPPVALVPEGYELRLYRDGDEADWIRLMTVAGFEGWTRERVATTLRHVVPRGFFVAAEKATGRLAAAAMAIHLIRADLPYTGELGWVAGDPAHKGRGVGQAVCAAVTARLLEAGYERIGLLTDDFRLAAIKIYLKLGYRPVMDDEPMRARWAKVTEQLGWRIG